MQDLKIIGVLLLLFVLFLLYHITLRTNVIIKSEKYYAYVPPSYSADQLAEYFRKKNVIRNGLSLKILAGWMGFKPLEKGGIFLIEQGWNNYQLIDHINTTEPIPAKNLSIPAVRHRSSFARIVSSQLKLDKDRFKELLKDSALLVQYKAFDKESIYCMFIPGNYYIPETSKEEEVIQRMHDEFLNFWNDARLEKAEECGLSPIQAMILASIVYAETKNHVEMPLIAGVYLNRLKKKMRLESDPTLVYATGSFSARRVYKNKKVLFPEYNTYARKGLPPGPVFFPPVKAIEAVLNYEEHDYLYFCAKDDSSGCHTFADSFSEHKENADKYRKYLNDRKIF